MYFCLPSANATRSALIGTGKDFMIDLHAALFTVGCQDFESVNPRFMLFFDHIFVYKSR